MLRRGLRRTAAYWPPVRAAYAWVERVAEVLANTAGADRDAVARRLRGTLGALARAARRTRVHRGALEHFLRVTRSDWPGLLRCYADADLPRTNNDLEQLFGAHRYHERRASGRRRGAPGVVVHGTVRVIAAVATRVQRTTGPDLAPRDLAAWRALRVDQDQRRALRTLGRRFRRNPEQYLASLEALLIKLTLPS